MRTDHAAPLLLRDVEVEGRRVDVRCASGAVTHVGVVPGRGDEIDAAGGALLPGLHDHHVHLMAMAAALQSVQLGPPAVRSAQAFDVAVRDAATTGTGPVRGVGYHESVAGPLDRDRLDDLVAHRPVRVQHRSGQLWVLNTAALRMAGLETLRAEGIERDATGRSTGRLYRRDDLVRTHAGGPLPDAGAAAAVLAARGVTAVTDLTPSTDEADLRALADAARRPGFAVAVAVTGGAELADVDVGLARGPVKIVLDDARLPGLDDLVEWFRTARRAGRPVAVHCVTRAELVLALAAWDVVGSQAGDRVEHAAVVPSELVGALREHGLTVVTQPALVASRGDGYLHDVDADDIAHLWRCASLLDAGVGVAGSSDAPYGDPDPWRAIAAARDRLTTAGDVLGPHERVTARRALDLYLAPLDDPAGSSRRVAPGVAADLCLLAEPLDVALADPAAVTVRATVRGGAVVA